MAQNVPLQVTVNGESHSSEVQPRLLLVHYLRDDLGLTGTHVGCDTSNCGACTCHVDGESVKSCTVLAVQCDGAEITTIEGMAGADGDHHPLQQGFWDKHGLQCGYCTPGMIMAAADLHRPPRRRAAHRGRRPQGPGGQPLPLHGLPEHRQGRARGRRGRTRGDRMSTVEKAPAKWVGQSLRRKEDPRLITGRATYVDDITLPGQLWAAIVRSPEAHANDRLDRRLRGAGDPRHQGRLHRRGPLRPARPAADGLGAARRRDQDARALAARPRPRLPRRRRRGDRRRRRQARRRRRCREGQRRLRVRCPSSSTSRRR